MAQASGRPWWVLAVAALAIGAAAGSLVYVVINDVDTPAVEHLDNGMPVARGVLRGPGTELGPGFEVAEGSWLVGGVVPFEYPGGDRGWRAVLAVDRPGRVVFDDYAAQADQFGVALLPSRDSSTCTLRGGDLICAANGAGGQEESLSVAIELHQAPASGPVPPQSTLTIEVQEWESGAAQPPGEPGSIEPQATGAEGSVPSRWPPLPREGEPFWSMRNAARGGPEDFRVPRGTRILAHSSVLDIGESWTLFEVTGEVEAVMRHLQAEDDGDRCPIQPIEQAGGVMLWWSCWTGSGSHVMWAVERPGEPAWLLLQANPLT